MGDGEYKSPALLTAEHLSLTLKSPLQTLMRKTNGTPEDKSELHISKDHLRIAVTVTAFGLNIIQ